MTASPFESLQSARGPCALLESVTAGPRAQLSLLAHHPRAVLVADRSGCRIRTPSGERAAADEPFAVLRELLAELPPGRWPDEGGIVGVLAYDYARPKREPAPTPLLVALAVERFEVWERDSRLARGREVTAWPADDVVAGPRVPPLAGWTGGKPLRLSRGDLPAYSNLTRAEHRALVLRIREHIAAGDVYQANLAQQFRVPWPAGGLALYRELRRGNPAPFAGYLRAAGIEIVSASPERLLHVEGERASTRPIAGTRPRSADPEQDRALARELLLSEKERAEHLMLVDLERNDLGQVAAIGSVEVDELMGVEEYAHVRHIVSNVRARLAPGRDALDALLALFPGGTITGVPKIRCMEILDALEPSPRGFYTGSLFYVTPSGRLDANILIRSAVVTEGTVSFAAGGGIVADSEPDAEYEETLHKAEGMRVALQAATRT